MHDTTRQTIIAAALAKATQLCDAALANLTKGRRAFVKGKEVYVPWSPEARAQRLALQRDAFTRGGAYGPEADVVPVVEPHYAAEGVTTPEAEDAFLREAVALWTATGVAEVERRFAEAPPAQE